MLDILRKKKTQKRILWFLAAIIVPAFVLWGAGSISKKESPYKYIGVIEGKKVPLRDFARSLRDVRVNLFLNFFNQPELFKKLLDDKALVNNFAWEKLIVKEIAKKNKISVSDKEVIAFVTTHPLFSRGGGFDDKTYNYVLRYTLGMTARDFEESVRDALINTKFREWAVKDITVSDDEVLRDYKEKNEKVKLGYVVIDTDTFKDGSELAGKLYEKSASSLSLKKSLLKLKKEERKNLEARETDLISRSDYIEGIGEAREAVDIAFGLGKGRISEPFKVRKGFALIEPVEFAFIDEKKFEEEKADYKAKLLDAKKAEAFQKWLQNEKLNSTLTANLDKL